LALLVQGCVPDDTGRAPARYGLAETANGRVVIEQAVVMVDAMLGSDSPLRLGLTWTPSDYFPALDFRSDSRRAGFTREIVSTPGYSGGFRFYDASVLPVYIIDGADLGNVEIAFVPESERCIFINAGALERLYATFFLTGPQAIENYAGFDKSLAVAFVLLHELGHIHFGDGSSYGKPTPLNIEELRLASAKIVNKEVRADRFASEVLNEAWQSQEMTSRINGPYGRAAISSNVFRVLSIASNTFDLRNDPQGLLTGQSRPYLFGRTGYSHLNLYLRLLVILQQLDPDPVRLEELRWVASNQSVASNGGHEHGRDID
jgi:hypothetical protein